MSPGERDLGALLRGLDPVLHPEELVWCTVPHGAVVPELPATAVFARVEEDEGVTLIVRSDDAARAGLVGEVPSRRIEMRVASSIEAVGMTAAMSGALAADGLSANVVAAFHHDHVLVPAGDAEAAWATLVELTAPATLRAAAPDDADDLWTYVGWAGEALDGRGEGEDPRTVPKLQRYVAGFGTRPGDLGVVADGPAGRTVGAAWVRLLVGDEQADETFVDDATPELAIACRPSQRGRGLGDALMDAVLGACRAAGTAAVVLSVREGNPARRLYERHGFAVVGTVSNRIGGRSDKMLCRLAGSRGPRRS